MSHKAIATVASEQETYLELDVDADPLDGRVGARENAFSVLLELLEPVQPCLCLYDVLLGRAIRRLLDLGLFLLLGFALSFFLTLHRCGSSSSVGRCRLGLGLRLLHRLLLRSLAFRSVLPIALLLHVDAPVGVITPVSNCLMVSNNDVSTHLLTSFLFATPCLFLPLQRLLFALERGLARLFVSRELSRHLLQRRTLRLPALLRPS